MHFFFGEAQVTWTDHTNQATQGSEQKLPATWQTGTRHGRNCVLTALLQLGGKLSLLQQGPAAAHPNQKSGRFGRSVADTDGKRNQAAPPRPLITASSQQAWLKTHCTRLPKTCTGADRGGKLSLPLTNPAQLYFKPQVKLTHVTTTVKHADHLPAWA